VTANTVTHVRPGMDSRVRRVAERLLVWSPAQPLSRWRSSAGLVVLAYHDIAEPAAFDRQMALLAETMCPVSLDDVLRALSGRARLPERAALVTFDDGNPSIHDIGLPVLRRYAIPAVAFVIAELIGTSLPYWWDEVTELVRRGGREPSLPIGDAASCVRALKKVSDDSRRTVIEALRESAGGPPVRARQLSTQELRTLADEGVAIGNHTYSHPCLDRCSDRQARSEIADAHETLCQMLGQPPRSFAFPNGNVDARTTATLSSLGYEAAFLFDHRVARLPLADPFQISRVRANSTDSMDRFRLLLSGLHPRIHAAMGRG